MDDWSPTMMLRWTVLPCHETQTTLQQLWTKVGTDENGYIQHTESEWRNVPFEATP